MAASMLLSNRVHAAIFVGISVAFWIAFNVLDQLLFFYPFLDFYLPSDAVPTFLLSNVTSVLMGLVVSTNVYILRNLKLKKISASMFSGTSLGMISGACASCTSLGFLLVSTFGVAGTIASNVLSNFQIPLRLISIGLLVWALYSSSRKLTASCMISKTD
jgi:hypothetical protein